MRINWNYAKVPFINGLEITPAMDSWLSPWPWRALSRSLGAAGHGQGSMSAVRQASVEGMPRSAARRSAIASRRRIRPAIASLVSGGSAS